MAKLVLNTKDIQKLTQMAPLAVHTDGAKGLVISFAKDNASLSMTTISCEGNLSIRETVFQYSATFDNKGLNVSIA